MIDFKKKVDKKALSVVTDPIAIYGKVDCLLFGVQLFLPAIEDRES